MSGLIIIHKAYQAGDAKFLNLDSALHRLVWQTCRREILFLPEEYQTQLSDFKDCDVYQNLEAEAFLIEILCGLKSPLIGETEVFGQFKTWWQNQTALEFKTRYDSRIQNIYASVKKIRDENLCGMGAQSYGSLLRKKLDLEHNPENTIDFIGAGQLTSDILPWLQEKWSCRIWCREPQKAKSQINKHQSTEIFSLQLRQQLQSKVLVVAAPLPQPELEDWISQRLDLSELTVYDFRRDSMMINWNNKPAKFFHLNQLTDEVLTQQESLQQQVSLAQLQIRQWVETESKRAQVRPFGWDDL